MNRRQATKWSAKQRKEWKVLKRQVLAYKPWVRRRWCKRNRAWWKAWDYRWEAELRKDLKGVGKMTDDLISRQEAIKAIMAYSARPQAYTADEWHSKRGFCTGLEVAAQQLRRQPPAKSEDWMAKNKDRILQAGMEGREVEFRIGGRLFAIREKAG